MNNFNYESYIAFTFIFLSYLTNNVHSDSKVTPYSKIAIIYSNLLITFSIFVCILLKSMLTIRSEAQSPLAECSIIITS